MHSRLRGLGHRTVRPSVSTGALLERLAALLEAGLTPPVAWRHLASSTDDPATRGALQSTADALGRGSPGAPALVDAVSRRATETGWSGDVIAEWGQVAAAWQVSEDSGAPLAPCLRSAADALRSTAQARRDAAVALSGPVSTSRIVLVLPVVGILLGLLMGVDSIAVLVGTPAGWFCLAASAGLAAGARAWSRRLVSGAAPGPSLPGLDLDLLAIALAGGRDWRSSRHVVQEALHRYAPAVMPRAASTLVDEIHGLAEEAGIAGAALLRSAAEEERRTARSESAMAAERLGVRLMLPLGVCILPSFLLVGVVPLLIALLSSTAA